MVQNIGELVTKVLPHSFETPFGGEGTRERIQDIMKYNRKILEEMGREPTFPPPAKDGKCSEARKKMIKSMKKNFGLQPYGELEAYSTTILPKEVGKLLNSREKESLDLQWAVLQATWLQLEP
ncbi:unnamed protein product [Cladocopium goreaui]|uniref:Uncharacterized protein n=1 Tax=Cladocopium goreaui TaxID=2562237 RepID=A0A9P1DIB7_9DINO|nr:unnamed protein product [Cladocopium goreaui]